MIKGFNITEKILLCIWKRKVNKLYHNYVNYRITKTSPFRKDIEQCKIFFSLFEEKCSDVFNSVKNISASDIQEKLTFAIYSESRAGNGSVEYELTNEYPPGISLLKKMEETKKRIIRKYNRTMDELMDWFCVYINLYNLSNYYEDNDWWIRLA